MLILPNHEPGARDVIAAPKARTVRMCLRYRRKHPWRSTCTDNSFFRVFTARARVKVDALRIMHALQIL